MTIKYSQSIGLIFLIILCLNIFSNAQIPARDSVEVAPVKTISIAYGIQPEWMVTGAVSSVKGNNLPSSFSTEFTGRLYGRIPGLTVNAGGTEPGNENASVYSRG